MNTMSKLIGKILLIFTISAVCLLAIGDIYGSFPGLDKLIEKSEAICVVEIIDPPPDPGRPYDPTNGTISGIYQSKRVQNHLNIKGDLPLNREMDLSMCYLKKSGSGTYKNGDVFLSFTRKTNFNNWETINCEGGVVKVSPLIIYDPMLINAKEARDCKSLINQIFKRSLELENQKLREMEKEFQFLLSK
jgi:hypothetical protein